MFPRNKCAAMLLLLLIHRSMCFLTFVCFGGVSGPIQFGQPDKAMPSHGVARTATWKLSEEQTPEVDGHVKVCSISCTSYVCGQITRRPIT